MPQSRRSSSTSNSNSNSNSIGAAPPLWPKGSDVEIVARSLQQRCDILQAQNALAEAAMRDAAQRQAATFSLHDAAQAEIRYLMDALDDRSRECAAKCQAIQEHERSAVRDLSCVVSCASFTLSKLASLRPRTLHTDQVRFRALFALLFFALHLTI
jgi:hypothetical protein